MNRTGDSRSRVLAELCVNAAITTVGSTWKLAGHGHRQHSVYRLPGCKFRPAVHQVTALIE